LRATRSTLSKFYVRVSYGSLPHLTQRSCISNSTDATVWRKSKFKHYVLHF